MKECPTCNGIGKEWIDGDIIDGWMTCSRCNGIGKINDDGTCPGHPKFKWVGVYSPSSAGFKYMNKGICSYCGAPAPGYEEALKKQQERERERKQEEKRKLQEKRDKELFQQWKKKIPGYEEQIEELKEQVDDVMKDLESMKKLSWNACLDHLVLMGMITYNHAFEAWRHDDGEYEYVLDVMEEAEEYDDIDEKTVATELNDVIEHYGHFKDVPEVAIFLEKYLSARVAPGL